VERPRIRPDDAADHLREGALAGSVLAEQRQDLALAQRETHAVDGEDAWEVLGDAVDIEHDRGVVHSGLSRS